MKQRKRIISKKALEKRTIRRFLLKTLSLALSVIALQASCVKPQGQTQLDQAKLYEEKLDYKNAVRIYEKIFKTSSNKDLVLLSAFRAQELSYLHTKEYRKARKYLEYFIANTNSFSEAQESLKRLAYIEHKILNLYEAAIRTYHRILNYNKLDKEEEKMIRLEVARCHYSINEFDQALRELDRLVSPDDNDEFKMVTMMLKSNVLQAQGHPELAVQSMDKVMQLNLSDDHKKDVALNKAIILEHQEKYKEALLALEQIASPGDVIEEKKIQLKRLAKFQRSRKE